MVYVINFESPLLVDFNSRKLFRAQFERFGTILKLYTDTDYFFGKVYYSLYEEAKEAYDSLRVENSLELTMNQPRVDHSFIQTMDQNITTDQNLPMYDIFKNEIITLSDPNGEIYVKHSTLTNSGFKLYTEDEISKLPSPMLIKNLMKFLQTQVQVYLEIVKENLNPDVTETLKCRSIQDVFQKLGTMNDNCNNNQSNSLRKSISADTQPIKNLMNKKFAVNNTKVTAAKSERAFNLDDPAVLASLHRSKMQVDSSYKVRIIGSSKIKEGIHWVTLIDNVDMAEKLNKYINAEFGSFKPLEHAPQTSKVYAGKLNNAWSRAMVMSNSPLTVIFCDLGRYIKEYNHELRILPQDIASLPPQSYRININKDTQGGSQDLQIGDDITIVPSRKYDDGTYLVALQSAAKSGDYQRRQPANFNSSTPSTSGGYGARRNQDASGSRDTYTTNRGGNFQQQQQQKTIQPKTPDISAATRGFAKTETFANTTPDLTFKSKSKELDSPKKLPEELQQQQPTLEPKPSGFEKAISSPGPSISSSSSAPQDKRSSFLASLTSKRTKPVTAPINTEPVPNTTLSDKRSSINVALKGTGIVQVCDILSDDTFVGFILPETFFDEMTKIEELSEQNVSKDYKAAIGDTVAMERVDDEGNKSWVRALVINKVSAIYSVALIDHGIISQTTCVAQLDKYLDQIVEFTAHCTAKPELIASLKAIEYLSAETFKYTATDNHRFTMFVADSPHEIVCKRWNPFETSDVAFKKSTHQLANGALTIKMEEPPQTVITKLPDPVKPLQLKDTVMLIGYQESGAGVDFYARTRDMTILKSEMQKNVFQDMTPKLLNQDPQIGQLVLHKKDENWCRCQVIELSGDDIGLRMVDFPDTVTVTTLQNIYYLEPREAKTAATMHKFALKNIKAEHLTQKVKEELDEYVKNKSKFAVLMENNEIDLTNPDCKTFSGKLLNLSRPQYKRISDLRFHDLELRKEYKMTLMHVDDFPATGCVTFWHQADLNVFIDEQELYNSATELPTPNIVYVDQVVMARDDSEEWFRASVLEYDDSTNKCKVFSIDYGNIQDTILSNIREMPDNFLNLPPFCIICSFEESLTKEEAEAIKELLDGHLGNTLSISLNTKSQKNHVFYYNMSTDVLA